MGQPDLHSLAHLRILAADMQKTYYRNEVLIGRYSTEVKVSNIDYTDLDYFTYSTLSV